MTDPNAKKDAMSREENQKVNWPKGKAKPAVKGKVIPKAADEALDAQAPDRAHAPYGQGVKPGKPGA